MAEVMHRHVEEELLVEPPPMWRPDETAPGSGDLTSSSSITSDETYGYKIEEEVDKNNIIFEKNEGSTFEWSVSGKDIRPEDHVDMTKLVNAIINSQNRGDVINEEIVPDTKSGGDDKLKGVVDGDGEIEDEEVVELEFERAVEKVHTHTPHCPNCNSQITKVVLRRKIKRRVPSPPEKRFDVFRCFSCFSIFIPSGNGLNPFRIFGEKGEQEGKQEGKQIVDENQSPASGGRLHASAEGSTNVGGTTTIKRGTASFDLFSIFKKRKENDIASDNDDKVIKREGEISNINEGESSVNNNSSGVSSEIAPSSSTLPVGQVAIDIGPQCKTEVFPKNNGSRALEIVKCIVYGGLVESITSLSVVSSAAASDVTTLNIIAIGLASVIGSLPIFGQNLMALRSKNSNQETDKYQEVLGKRGHFLLHASFAIISFMIFGFLPPVIYGFTFRGSDNKDYKILAVAAASFACILVLAILKAYVRSEKKISGYVKTIMYYLTMAVSVSGVSYAAGDLIKLAMERLGLFEPSQPAATTFVPGMISATSTPAWLSSY